MIISLLYLHYLGEAVNVADCHTDISVMLVVGHVEGRQVARGSVVATRGVLLCVFVTAGPIIKLCVRGGGGH